MPFPDFPKELNPSSKNHTNPTRFRKKQGDMLAEEETSTEKVDLMQMSGESGSGQADPTQLLRDRRSQINRHEIAEIIHSLIDLPIKTVTGILRISHHTLLDIRKSTGYEDWPYDKIRGGTYSVSAIQVAINRSTLLSQMPTGCPQHRALALAREMSATPTPTEAWAAAVVPDPTETDHGIAEAMQEENVTVSEHSEEELNTWFASLLEPDDNGVKKPEDEQESLLEQRKREEDSFWQDVNSTRSAEEQEYWASLLAILQG